MFTAIPPLSLEACKDSTKALTGDGIAHRQASIKKTIASGAPLLMV